MSWRRLAARVLDVGRSGRRAAEVDGDIADHLAELEAEYQASGLTGDEARLAARRDFGSVALARERTTEMWRFAWLDDLLRDLRFGVRMTWRNRGMSTIVVVVVMAVGIGSSTAIFSLVDAFLLHSIVNHQARPIPGVDARWSVVHSRLADGSVSNFFSIYAASTTCSTRWARLPARRWP